MSAEIWGPWIEHDGRGIPAPIGTWVHAKSMSSEIEGRIGDHGCGGWTWLSPHPRRSVIRYRIRKPRGLTILEELLVDLPEPSKPRVDA